MFGELVRAGIGIRAAEGALDQTGCGVAVLRVLEELGGGKKTHSVFDGDAPRPMCISRPNLPKWW